MAANFIIGYNTATSKDKRAQSSPRGDCIIPRLRHSQWAPLYTHTRISCTYTLSLEDQGNPKNSARLYRSFIGNFLFSREKKSQTHVAGSMPFITAIRRSESAAVARAYKSRTRFSPSRNSMQITCLHISLSLSLALE